ncbi:MAG: hypothetical protein IPN76_34805 [Saprospiraceae bacterium]|nr:hypothetical protein [Saprospiraceae bacterium]
MNNRQGKYSSKASRVFAARWPIHLLVGLFIFCGPLPSALAQANTWRQDLNFGSYDFARGLFPTPDGGYVAAGHTGNGPDLRRVHGKAGCLRQRAVAANLWWP